MSKAVLVFGLCFLILFLDMMLLYMSIPSDSQAEGLTLSSLVTGGNIFKVGELFFDELPPFISIFFIALNIMGIAVIVLVLRGI